MGPCLYRITESGSTVAALQEGMMVATVYGTTLRKKRAPIWEKSIKGVTLKLG